jgi:hypothetical protein
MKKKFLQSFSRGFTSPIEVSFVNSTLISSTKDVIAIGELNKINCFWFRLYGR